MGEYVEREKFAEKLKEHLRCTSKGSVLEAAFAAMLQDLEELPAADVAPVVHGHWEGVFQDGVCSWSGRCSVCGVRNDIPHPMVANYCPNCGAKMDGGGEDA